MIVVSVCLPSDALSQCLPSYLGFSYLGCVVSFHDCFSKAQPVLLTLDEEYLLTATPPDLEHGIALFGPPAPLQPPLLGCTVAHFGHRPDLGHGVAPLGCRPLPWMCGSSSRLILCCCSLVMEELVPQPRVKSMPPPFFPFFLCA